MIILTSIRRLLLVLLINIVSIGGSMAQDVEIDRIRAVVNEEVVLDSDLRKAIRFFKLQATGNAQSIPPDNVIEERLLEQLIDREVRRQHARTLGIAIDPGTLNRAIEQIASNNNMDISRFRQTIQQQGFDYDGFRENIEQDLLLQRLIERDVQSRIRVSQQEIDDFVDAAQNDVAGSQQYRISHILIALPSTASEAQQSEATSRAETVLEQLRSGSDFAQVAAASSDGSRALQGGDLGWRTLQELPEFLSTAVKDLDEGDLAGPLRSDNGLHIVQLANKQSDDPTKQSETLARHIFISGNDANIPAQLDAARTDITRGTPFAQLAAQLSQDPNSADNGGELPWFSQGQMPVEMEEVANSLSIEQISQPFRTQFGWHLLQVLDRRERDVDQQALREQAQSALRLRKVEQETERWSRQLRDDSFVEIRS